MRRHFVILLSIAMAACSTHISRPRTAPTADVQLKLATLPRVWVAGFATDRKPEFDLNTETVRLLRTQLRTWSSAQVVEAEPLPIDSERRLSDVVYWQRLGEEHRQPLIITGSVKLRIAPARLVQRGIRAAYAYADGRVLDATVVVIDGRTGKVLSTDKLPSRMQYGVGRFSSALSLFLQMMDAGMGDWFGAISHVPVTDVR
ncbi:MAG TPA: hypothetical protein VGJ52_11425 [Vicinamibacterales bacterium]|jgi:hypothetical protein